MNSYLGNMISHLPCPAYKDLEVFLDVFNKLDSFEVEQYYIRGACIFDRATTSLPIPGVVKVMEYLQGLKDIMEKEGERA